MPLRMRRSRPTHPPTRQPTPPPTPLRRTRRFRQPTLQLTRQRFSLPLPLPTHRLTLPLSCKHRHQLTHRPTARRLFPPHRRPLPALRLLRRASPRHPSLELTRDAAFTPTRGSADG